MKTIQKIDYNTTFFNRGQEGFLKTVRKKLPDLLGNFCSYCEMPLAGDKVEHIRYSSRWRAQISEELLDDLLLICHDCRHHIATPQLTEASMQNMLWPDRDMTFSTKESASFIYELHPVTYRVMDGSDVASEEQLELVFILPNPDATEPIKEKAQNTIDHFQLNMKTAYHSNDLSLITIPKTEHNEMADNRIFHRTQTWKLALEAVEHYTAIKELTDMVRRDDILSSFKRQITRNAFFRGNWSVWMTVFNQRFNNQDLLNELFMKDEHFFGKIR